MENLIKIENSSNLTGYYYDPPTKCLFIEFRGGALYRYDLVPPTVVEEFQKSESKGSFLARHIKDKFKCLKFTKSADKLDNMESDGKEQEKDKNDA